MYRLHLIHSITVYVQCHVLSFTSGSVLDLTMRWKSGIVL